MTSSQISRINGRIILFCQLVLLRTPLLTQQTLTGAVLLRGRAEVVHMAQQLQAVRVVVVPGNGSGNVHTANWYGWLNKKLKQRPGVTAVLEDMPGAQEEGAGGKWGASH